MANFSELDRYLFGQATHYEIYRKLGAHFTDQYGIRGVCFDVWAPNAARIWVIGSFNGWDETADEMTRLEPDTMGIFELFIPGIEEGALYKYLIETKDGKRLYKADPYANYAELRPGTASAVADIDHLNGLMKNGWKSVLRPKISMQNLWQSMRCIRVPGNDIRAERMTDFTVTGIL